MPLKLSRPVRPSRFVSFGANKARVVLKALRTRAARKTIDAITVHNANDVRTALEALKALMVRKTRTARMSAKASKACMTLTTRTGRMAPQGL